MKTKLHTEKQVVTIKWWTCAKAEHRHRTREVAEACIDRTSRLKCVTIKWPPALKREVFACVVSGGTWAAAAQIAGISEVRAQQVVHKMLRKMREPSHHWDGEMPPHDIYSVKDVRKHREFWLRRLDEMIPP